MTLIVARYVLKECLRRRVFIVVPVLTVVFLTLYAVGTSRVVATSSNLSDQSGLVDTRTLIGSTMLGLSMFATLFLGAVLATFLTFTVVRGDAEQGLLQPLVVRPLGRPAFLLGRCGGAFVVAGTYVAVLFLACVVITGLVTDWWPDRIAEPALQLGAGIGFVVVMAILGSVFLSTIANGIAVLMIFGAGLTAGLLQQIGEALGSESLQDVGRVTANVLPFEALYQAALQALTADLFGITGFAVRLGPFGGGQPLSAALYAWFVVYFALLLAGCILAFGRKDI